MLDGAEINQSATSFVTMRIEKDTLKIFRIDGNVKLVVFSSTGDWCRVLFVFRPQWFNTCAVLDKNIV